jgi:hypothetical protein
MRQAYRREWDIARLLVFIAFGQLALACRHLRSATCQNFRDAAFAPHKFTGCERLKTILLQDSDTF